MRSVMMIPVVNFFHSFPFAAVVAVLHLFMSIVHVSVFIPFVARWPLARKWWVFCLNSVFFLLFLVLSVRVVNVRHEFHIPCSLSVRKIKYFRSKHIRWRWWWFHEFADSRKRKPTTTIIIVLTYISFNFNCSGDKFHKRKLKSHTDLQIRKKHVLCIPSNEEQVVLVVIPWRLR